MENTGNTQKTLPFDQIQLLDTPIPEEISSLKGCVSLDNELIASDERVRYLLRRDDEII